MCVTPCKHAEGVRRLVPRAAATGASERNSRTGVVISTDFVD